MILEIDADAKPIVVVAIADSTGFIISNASQCGKLDITSRDYYQYRQFRFDGLPVSEIRRGDRQGAAFTRLPGERTVAVRPGKRQYQTMIQTFPIGPRGISKRFGKNVVLDSTAIDLRSHDCTVITASNRTGKTALPRIIAGLEKPDRGEVVTHDAIARPRWRQRQRLLESVRQSRQA